MALSTAYFFSVSFMSRKIIREKLITKEIKQAKLISPPYFQVIYAIESKLHRYINLFRTNYNEPLDRYSHMRCLVRGKDLHSFSTADIINVV